MNRNTKRFMRAADPAHVSECMAEILKQRARVLEQDFTARIREWWDANNEPDWDCDPGCDCWEHQECPWCLSADCLFGCNEEQLAHPVFTISLLECVR
jgi:hypothetical protein